MIARVAFSRVANVAEVLATEVKAARVIPAIVVAQITPAGLAISRIAGRRALADQILYP